MRTQSATQVRDADRHRRSHLMRAYGLTVEQYDTMVLVRGGTCDLCGQVPTGAYPLGVDHDHDTRAVRGLLCARCNGALGILGDNVEGLTRALAHVAGGSR